MYVFEVVTSSKHRGAPGKHSFGTCSCYTLAFSDSVLSTTHTQIVGHIVLFQLHTQIFLLSYFCMNFGFHACILSLEVMKISIWDIQTPIEMALEYF